jgi:hypothetical protein
VTPPTVADVIVQVSWHTGRPDAAWDAYMLGSAHAVLMQAGYHVHPVAGDDGPASLTVTARKAA